LIKALLQKDPDCVPASFFAGETVSTGHNGVLKFVGKWMELEQTILSKTDLQVDLIKMLKEKTFTVVSFGYKDLTTQQGTYRSKASSNKDAEKFTEIINIRSYVSLLLWQKSYDYES
ncbi:protein of unknown function DUF1725 containing protein, partial [Cricetulus griseus]